MTCRGARLVRQYKRDGSLHAVTTARSCTQTPVTCMSPCSTWGLITVTLCRQTLDVWDVVFSGAANLEVIQEGDKIRNSGGTNLFRRRIQEIGGDL